MRRTARISTKSVNMVDCKNSVDAVDYENSLYAVDCENSVYAVDSANSHKLGVCSGQQELAHIQQMQWTVKTRLMW